MGNATVFLVDASGFCYRAFYAIRGLSTSTGRQTNAVFGFVRMLRKIIKEYSPEYMAVCFDVSRETFRQEKFAQYKSQREAMPDGLAGQMADIKEIVRAHGIPLYEMAGYEADDIIATLARKARAAGMNVEVISSDKDLVQLAGDGITVINPSSDEPAYDAAAVKDKFGVEPAQIPDLIALTGDSSDNIPAIKGISPKVAAALLAEFGSAGAIINRAGSITNAKVRKAVQDNADQISLNRELAGLVDTMDIGFSPDSLKIKKQDTAALADIFTKLELRAFLKELGTFQPGAELSGPAQFCSQEEFSAAARACDILYIAGTTADTLCFGAGDRVLRPEKIGAPVEQILRDPDIKKAGYDLKRVKVSLAAEGLALEGLAFDALIAGYLISPGRSSFKLEDIAWEMTKKPVPGDIDPASAVAVVRKIKPLLEEALQKNGLTELFLDLEMPLVEVLAYTELNGIKIDREKLRKLSSELEQRLAKLIRGIYELCGCEFNLNSPKQLREILFERLKLPVVKKTKTGPSTDEEVLRNLASRHDLPKMLLEYRQLSKLKSTYIDALPLLVNPATGRLHTTLNQAGTETGRLSSSNLNLQNIPVRTELGRSIRGAIISYDTDSLLLSCDYSQIELRILAHLSGDPGLIEAFKQDSDIHRRTAALIYGINEKEVSDEQRNSAKRVNFGIVYGLSSYGLSRDLSLPIDEAQKFIDAYFATYPGVKKYLDDQIARARQDGYVTTIMGRKRFIPEINDRNMSIRQFAQRQAVNTPIQGSASDLIKLAMIKIHGGMKKSLSGSRMILQIHDELLFDVPKRDLRAFAAFVRETMENVMKLRVPLKVDMAAGPDWNAMDKI